MISSGHDVVLLYGNMCFCVRLFEMLVVNAMLIM